MALAAILTAAIALRMTRGAVFSAEFLSIPNYAVTLSHFTFAIWAGTFRCGIIHSADI